MKTVLRNDQFEKVEIEHKDGIVWRYCYRKRDVKNLFFGTLPGLYFAHYKCKICDFKWVTVQEEPSIKKNIPCLFAHNFNGSNNYGRLFKVEFEGNIYL